MDLAPEQRDLGDVVFAATLDFLRKGYPGVAVSGDADEDGCRFIDALCENATKAAADAGFDPDDPANGKTIGAEASSALGLDGGRGEIRAVARAAASNFVRERYQPGEVRIYDREKDLEEKVEAAVAATGLDPADPDAAFEIFDAMIEAEVPSRPTLAASVRRPGHGLPRRGRAPRLRSNHRSRGSRRTSARAGPDDPDDPEPPALTPGAWRLGQGVAA